MEQMGPLFDHLDPCYPQRRRSCQVPVQDQHRSPCFVRRPGSAMQHRILGLVQGDLPVLSEGEAGPDLCWYLISVHDAGHPLRATRRELLIN